MPVDAISTTSTSSSATIPNVEVVAITAAQIPNIDQRTYPSALSGPNHPNGIPIRPQDELERLVADHEVGEVVVSYSDLAHHDVMHLVSRVLATGADVRFLGPARTMLTSRTPVIAVVASRTGVGKSQTSRHLGRLLTDAGLRVALVRHPMPYGDLEPMRVQRFATLAEIDAADPTIEEREEYEEPVRRGLVIYAGVDYAAILAQAGAEADVIIWDGGNNDSSFFRPELTICLADALRPGHELDYHPGEVNLRMADIVVINKVDSAGPTRSPRSAPTSPAVNPTATIVEARSPVTLDPGPDLAGAVCSWSKTARPSPTAGCRSGPGGGRQGGRCVRADRPAAMGGRADRRDVTSGTPRSGRCCRRWDTATSSSPTCRPRCTPCRAMWW